MNTAQQVRCAVCGDASADSPRLTVEQDRHYDCPREHVLGLCPAHGEQLRRGQLALHGVLYEWIQKHHDELYDGTRLYMIPRLACLGCNTVFATNNETYACPTCATVNVVGTALGHPAAVRVAP